MSNRVTTRIGDEGADISWCDGEALFEFFYPRLGGHLKTLEVGLCDVRAADSIRISYDFERDGYKIEQASKFSWDADDEKCDPDWQEVFFVKAWARQVEE